MLKYKDDILTIKDDSGPVGDSMQLLIERLKALGIEEPLFYKQMKQNPYVAFIGLFMVNSYGNSMLSTGAFEVTFDGVEIFSKLKTGLVPNEEGIVNAMKQAGLSFNSRIG